MHTISPLRLLAPVAALALLGGCCKARESSPEPMKATPDVPATTVTPAPAATPEIEEDGYQANGFPKRMPKSRTAVPTAKEWRDAPMVTTKKLPDGCSMKFVREWLKLNCSKDTNTVIPLEVNQITGMGGSGADYFVFAKSGSVVDLVVRTVDGKKGTANFVTNRGTFQVGYDWPYKAPFPSTIFQ